MVRPARSLALAAFAALLAASPAAAQNRAMFTASLNPLANTTGVDLGGNGFARVAFNTGASNAPRGDNQFTLDVNNLGSPVVAVHIHKGSPSENGPIFLAVCGNTPSFEVQVKRPAVGKAGEFVTETVRRCSQASRESYSALPLASPKTAGADTLEAAFGAIEASPFGFYANVHTEESEKQKPDAGQIRGQLSREE